MPLTIEGELVAKSTGTVSAFTLGDRVFHQKFGNGNVTAIDGNKLTIEFDKAGEKRVVDFVRGEGVISTVLFDTLAARIGLWPVHVRI